MSILIVGDESSLAESLVRRLRDQDDEVRAIHAGPIAATGLAGLGVHIARGPYLDADLIERAGQNVRTVVAIEPPPEILLEILAGMRAASIPRLVVCGRAVDPAVAGAVRGAGLEFVIMRLPPKSLLRKGLSDNDVAEAIDAADDLAGSPELELDLAEEVAWDALRLDHR